MKRIFLWAVLSVATLSVASSAFIEDRATEASDLMTDSPAPKIYTGWEHFMAVFSGGGKDQQQWAQEAARQMNYYKQLFPARTISSMQEDLNKVNSAVRKTETMYKTSDHPLGCVVSNIMCMPLAGKKRALEFLIAEAQRAEKK